jgi:predicted PurR-regulated permease PerM
MEFVGLVSAGISFIVLIITIVTISNKTASKISVLASEINSVKEQTKLDIKRLDDELKFHITMQEKSFAGLEQQMKEIAQTVNIIKGYLEAKK